MLISENAYKINNSNTRNHVNFKSMLTYFGWQPRDVSHVNTDDIVEMIDNKGLLTVDMIKRLYQEYSEDIIRNIYYDDVFEVKEVTIKQALNHPKWSMGKKISIDSATMMNKGLEVIEASFLFNLPSERIEVLIHPQSIVHSFVEFIDGSSLTQLGCPDMRVPISFALGYPQRIPSGVNGIDLTKHEALSFSQPNHKLFPCLNLAYQALSAGQSSCVILNAANEIAVEAFLKGRIIFTKIHDVVKEAMNMVVTETNHELGDIIDLDKAVRARTHEIIAGIT
jgi:1-deoxy-D-xylulose-5-phosphate reductoisomerase